MGQYIGARYVPRFMGTYDATQIYEGLDVVDNGMGTSYIAKKPVPANTPLTNTAYWAIYGTSSGAIINLQNQIDELTRKVRKRVIIVGDSYGTGYSPDGTNTSYISLIASNFGIDNDDLYNASLYDAALSRSPYFLDGLQAIEANVNYPESITDIYIVGGYNDHGASAANITSGLQAFKTYCATQYPNAKLHLIFAGAIRGDNPTLRNQLITLIYDLPKLALDEGYTYDNVSNIFMLDSDMSSDHYHPSQQGQNFLANMVASVIYGDGGYNRKVTSTNVTFSDYGSNVVSSDDSIISITKDVKRSYFTLSNNIKGTFTLNGNAWNAVAKMTSDALSFPGNMPQIFLANLNVLDTNDSKYKTIPAQIGFEANRFYIRPFLLNSAGTSYQSLTVSELSFEFTCFEMDTTWL